MKPARSGLGRFVGELKRRRVFQVAAAYALVGWILVEVADTVFPHMELPEWAVTLVVWLVLLGFPLALLLAWAYDLTPDGVQATPPRNESDEASRPDPAEEPAAHGPAEGPGEAPPERPDAGEPDEAATSPSGATIGSRSAGLIGVGILLGLVLVGAYVGLTGPQPETADADPEAVDPAPGTADLDLDRVLVMTFENRTGDEDLDPVGLMASDGITRTLEATGVLRGVPAEQIFSGLGAEAVGEAHDEADIEALARSARARTVVTGRFYARGDSLQFEARARDLVRDEITHTFDPTTAPRSDPAPGLEALQEQIAVALALGVNPTHAAIEVGAHQSASLEAYRSYTRALRHFARRNFEDAITHFEATIEADPDFVAAHIILGTSHWNLGDRETADSIWATLEERRELLTYEQLLHIRWGRAAAQGDLARAYRLSRELAELVPGNNANNLLAFTAMALKRPAEAVQALALREYDPDWAPYWWHFGRALHMLGEYEEELEVGRKAVERVPGDLYVMRGKLRALAALGQEGEAARWLDAAMREPWSDGVSPGDVARYGGVELRAHGHEEAANAAFTRALEWYRGRVGREDWRPEIASTLYEARRWEDARPLAEELVEEAPDDDEPRSTLEVDFGFLAAGLHGAVVARMGDRAEAEGILNELTDAEEAPPEHFYWAARIASVLGEHDEAVALLERAFASGSRYWLALHRTIDFEPLHDHPGFQELLEPDG